MSGAGPDLTAALGGLVRHARPTRGAAAALAAARDRAVARLVAHAHARVPYWRRLFDEAGVDPRAVRTVADLARIPPSARAALQAEAPEALVARGLRPDRLIARTSSGTSGQRFTVRRTWLEQNLLHLYRLRAEALIGARLRDHRVFVALERAVEANDSKRLGRMLHRLGLVRRSRVSMLDEPAATLAHLRALAPAIVGGYPSTLARVAEAAARTGLALPRPRLVITGAETLTPGLRARIEAAFAAPVRNLYGCSECNLLGWECPASGVLHTTDDAVIVEVLAPDGTPVAPGAQGEVVVTALHNYAMPIIRYRLGDLARRPAAPCPCGLPFGALAALEGRVVDYFHLPDGRVVHPYLLTIHLVERTAPWARQYQLVQERVDLVTLRLVPGPEAPGADAVARVRAELAAALGPAVTVDVELADGIAPGAGGKVRGTRSLVHAARVAGEPARLAGGDRP
ncbi:MAG TPA: AMP-binding protein [Gemmatimonadales bacterium]|nr:AMP-binding protein [Gemmatimonadales bacterium]